MKANKRGDYQQTIIIAFLIGIIILSVSFLFFQELFTGSASDREICQQSLLLRAKAVEAGGGFLGSVGSEIGESTPFDCRAQGILIDYFDPQRATEEIAQAVADCFILYGEGRIDYYSQDFFTLERDYSCHVCSVIAFDESVVEQYVDTPLNVSSALMISRFSDGTSYFDHVYLSRPHKGGEEVLRQFILNRSIFNVSDGEIYVMNYFASTGTYNAAGNDALGVLSPAFFLLNLFDEPVFSEKDEQFSSVVFFQPNVAPEGLSICEGNFETKPPRFD